MKIYQLSNEIDKKCYLEKLEVDKGGVGILSSKMSLHLLYIKDLSVVAMNILKQDALSIGAEVASPTYAITHKKPKLDCILIANTKQLKILSKKELAQPFGLKELAMELKKFVSAKTFTPKIMGIINASSDSFFEKSYYDEKTAVTTIENMLELGTTMIDVGAVSTKPYSAVVSEEEELSRLQSVVGSIASRKLYERGRFSIDTTRASVARFALDNGFHIVNDISALGDANMPQVIGEYQAGVVLMHMQGTPQTMQNAPQYDNIVSAVDDFFVQKIALAKEYNIEDIILDVGIGFGKTLDHNVELVKHLRHFTHFGCELLVGASRKSMIDVISPTPTEDRLAGTLCIHQEALRNGASIIRCHDVKEHISMLKTLQAINENI